MSRVARAVGLVALGGLIGLATFIGQGVMPGQSNTLVNSGALWVVAVFVAGAFLRTPWPAVAVGLLMLLTTVAGYFVTAALGGAPVSTFSVVLWCVVAVVAGPLFGLAGSWWRGGSRPQRIAGVALIGAVFLAEGLFLIAVNGYWWSGTALVVVGLAGSLLLARRSDTAYTLLALPLPVLAAIGVYFLVSWVFSQRGA